MSAQTSAAARPRRFRTWVDHHLYSLVASVGRLLRRPWSTALTVGVMACALALPMGLWLLVQNVERFAGEAQRSRELGLFLRVDVDVARAEALAATLRQRRDVQAVQLRTPEQGLQEMRERGLGDALDALDSNPLPSVLIVTPRGDDGALARSLAAWPEVELVQHDAQWRERLLGWLRLGERAAAVLAVLFALGALLVVGNTVRLDIQSRREEIAVLQQLGATDGFIRRPFLYLGACYGLASGLLALGLLAAAGAALRGPLAELAASYGSRFALAGFSPAQVGLVAAAAMLLGWAGAGAVTGHYLRQTRPGED